MDHFYISPGYGNDSTGDGSEGAPYATFQKALDQTASPPNPTFFHVGNSAAETITTAHYFVNGAGSKWTYAYPFFMSPWDEGANGTLYQTINGVQTPYWKFILSGVDYLWDAGEYPQYAHVCNGFVDGGGNGRVSYPCLYFGAQSWLENLTVINTDGQAYIGTTSGSKVINCAGYNTDDTNYPTYSIYAAGDAEVIGCYANGSLNYGIYCSRVRHSVIRNFARGHSSYWAASGPVVFEHNAIIGGDHANSNNGVNYVTGRSEITNNIFMNLTYGAYSHTSFDNPFSLLGGNAWFNVTTKVLKDTGTALDALASVDMTEFDVDLTDDPFVDADNGDYRLKLNSPCRGRGLVWPIHLGGQLLSGGAAIASAARRVDIGPIPYGIPNIPITPGYAG